MFRPCARAEAGSCGGLTALKQRMFEPDPSDRRYRRRLAGSYLASLLIHLALAALLFSVLSNSSQQSASESVKGGEIVSLEQRAPVVPAAAPAQVAAPQPHAPRIAPVQ